jgi:CHAT domain-containing protein/predicted negative regulator of RcsB-dependent stress response
VESQNSNIRHFPRCVIGIIHGFYRSVCVFTNGVLIRLFLVLLILCFPLAASSSGWPRDVKASVPELEAIELGKIIHARLAGAESQIYRLRLTTNQFIHLLIDQRGIDVVVTLIGPDNTKLLKIDSPNGSEGNEHLLAIAQSPGEYLVEVRALEKYARVGEYTIKVDELRPAQANDYTKVRAYTAFTDGETLASQGGYGGPASLLRTALNKYEEALSLYVAIGDHSQEAQTLFRIGDVWSSLDENQKAIAYFDKALLALKNFSDQQLESDVLSKLGFAHSRLGESQKALEYSSRALVLVKQSNDRPREAVALYNLGTIYYSIGSVQRSLQCLMEALIIIREIRDKRFEAYTLQRLGILYMELGENQKALNYLQQSLNFSEESQDRRAQALGLSELAKVYTMMGRREEALVALEKALALSRHAAMRSVEAQTLNSLGTTYSLIGKNEEALDVFRQSLAQSRAIGDVRIQMEALYGIAKAEYARQRFIDSKQAIEAAIAIIDSTGSKIESTDIRQSYRASVQKFYGLYIDILMQMHRIQPSTRFDVLAFQANEGVRARNLLEMLRASHIDIRQGIDPSLLEREQDLQRAVNEMALRKMALIGTTDKEQALSVTKSLENLISQYEDIETEIRLKSPRYAALRNPVPLSLTDIQKRVLDNDTLLLEYSLGDDRSFLWAVTRDSIKSYELPKKAVIEADVRRLVEILDSPSRSPQQSQTESEKTPYLEAASRLTSILLGPVAKELGTKRLLVVGEGALQFLPFGALPNPVNSGRSAVIQPLMLQHEIVYAPSASIIETLRRETRDRNPPPKTVAVFGDPVFQRNDERLLTETNRELNGSRAHSTLAQNNLTKTGLNLPRLLYTRLEVQDIINLTPKGQSMMAVDFAANRQTVISGDLNQYRIIHFATHAFIDGSHPELSGIVLSLIDEKGNPQDGFLRLNEIYNLKLSADMVVLSGCSTGLGKEVKGEGVIGLTRGFMYAGSRRVIVSLWNTDDRSTSVLMNRFYSRMLMDGLSPAASLRAAQIQMWREKGWHDPYYWAAFVLQGDW